MSQKDEPYLVSGRVLPRGYLSRPRLCERKPAGRHKEEAQNERKAPPPPEANVCLCLLSVHRRQPQALAGFFGFIRRRIVNTKLERRVQVLGEKEGKVPPEPLG